MNEHTTCNLHRYEPYGGTESYTMMVGFCIKNFITSKYEYCETLVDFSPSQTKEEICQMASEKLSSEIEKLIVAVES